MEDEKWPAYIKTVYSFVPRVEREHSFLEKESLTVSKTAFLSMNLQQFGYPDRKNGVRKARYSDLSE